MISHSTLIGSELYEQIFRSIKEPLAVTDLSGRIVSANSAFAALVELDSLELIGQELAAFCGIAPETLAESTNCLSLKRPVRWRTYSGDYQELELEISCLYTSGTSGGSGYLLSARPLKGRTDYGSTLSSGGHAVDDPADGSAFPQTEAQEFQRQKLEALGVLASSIAHDLNNILTGVLGHISYLRLALSESNTHNGSLQAIEDAARRAASMTQKILDYARGQDMELCAVDMVQITTAAINLIQPTLPGNISLDYDCDESGLYVLADESQINQLILNLAVNARDALPAGGHISILLERLGMFDPERCDHLGLHEGVYVFLRIEDNGVGIPAHVRERIFEPFFTTKTAHGTGLGLAIVYSIIKALGGVIAFETTEGVGTRFDIYLPICAPDTEVLEDDDEEERQAVPVGDERILVVDDEEAVRTIIQRSLEHLGYDVMVAKNGNEAIEVFKTAGNAFRLIIIDMIMPQMAGDELFTKLQEIDPNVPVLIASGYSSDIRTRAILESGGLGFIQKPFAIEELAREVRRCLDLKDEVGT